MEGEERTKLAEEISKINSAQGIYNLFKYLNYPKTAIFDPTYIKKISEFEFAKEEKEKINKIYTVMSYDKLNVFLVEAKSITKPFLRYITKVFSNMYVRFLLILTSDYNEFSIVFPDYEKKEAGKHKLKTTTLILKKGDLYYTDIEIIMNIRLSDQKATWRDVWRIWRDSFNVEKVTENFFEEYKMIFFTIRKDLKRQKIDTKQAHEFSLQLLNRIMFIYFIAKKEWLNNDKKFMKSYWEMYKKTDKYGNDKFYSEWLRPLFFEAFNNNSKYHPDLPEEINKIFSHCPYLNGGLFIKNGLDHLKINISDSLFKAVFDFFEKFNFTIKEDSAFDIEVAVDPQMIGYVYESLANIAEDVYESEEDLRGDWGIFYTPKIEVDFMCRRSIVEYLSKHLDIPKDEIYEFVFDEDKEKIEKKFNQRKCWPKIEEVLDNLSIVDPACGSGAFLVGMLNVLSELYKRVYFRLERKNKTDYHIKKRIIGRSIYGVDVMPWAVHASELRLWLQLIVETEIDSENLRKEPLLPNFTMNIRVGDSLVQKIGNVTFNVRSNELDNKLKKKLEMLKSEKEKYFNNDKTGRFSGPEEILKEEVNLFEEIITQRIAKLDESIKSLQRSTSTKQTGLFGAEVKAEATNTMKKEVDALRKKQEMIESYHAEISNLKDLKKKLEEPGKKPFVWDIDFAEIFGEKNGFDIVIGNPPYVRHEKIVPPNKNKDEINNEDKKSYKELLIQSVQNRFPVIKNIDRKSDLYAYFYFHGLSLLNEDGVFCFITSNSWLDVGYGRDLQEFLLKYAPIYSIYDNPVRSFEHADVNTIIALFGAPNIGKRISLMDYGASYNGNGKNRYPSFKNIAKFVMFKKPFEEVINSKNMIEIDKINKIVRTEDYRVYARSQEELMEEGWEYPEEYELDKEHKFDKGEFVGDTWGGKYLRAPDIYFTILQKGLFKPLRSIGKIETYLNTGGADKFYFVDVTNKEKNISKIKNTEYNEEFLIETKFLQPIIRSSQELSKILIEQKDIKSNLISVNEKEKISTLKINEYFQFGVRKGYNKRSGPSGRVPWWKLPEQARKCSEILFPRNYSDKLVVYYNPQKFIANRFYRFETKKHELIILLLNSTLNLFMMELLGRRNLGLGALDLEKPELRNLPILEINIKLKSNHIINREIKSIFEECGIDPSKPIREQEPKPLPDRAELDNIIFDELKLTKEQKKEVYWAVCELVQQRLNKASSLKDK